MNWVARIAEERIQKAQAEGFFDNLSLRGQPLDLRQNPFVPDDLRLAYKLLRDAGFLPPEMEIKKEIFSLGELLSRLSDENEGQRRRLERDIRERYLKLQLMMERR